MAKSSTTFKKGESNAGRGKSFKNKLLDVIKDEALIGANSKMNHAELETLYLTHFARRAFDIDDAASPMLSKELLSKSYPSLKSTMPVVDFEFNESATPSIQASQILKAASDGAIPPDVAQIFISSIASMMKIEEVTEIAARLTEIEKALGLNNA
jgi:hypothetical protein